MAAAVARFGFRTVVVLRWSRLIAGRSRTGLQLAAHVSPGA
jgi:hypothetical protein